MATVGETKETNTTMTTTIPTTTTSQQRQHGTLFSYQPKASPVLQPPGYIAFPSFVPRAPALNLASSAEQAVVDRQGHGDMCPSRAPSLRLRSIIVSDANAPNLNKAR